MDGIAKLIKIAEDDREIMLRVLSKNKSYRKVDKIQISSTHMGHPIYADKFTTIPNPKVIKELERVNRIAYGFYRPYLTLLTKPGRLVALPPGSQITAPFQDDSVIVHVPVYNIDGEKISYINCALLGKIPFGEEVEVVDTTAMLGVSVIDDNAFYSAIAVVHNQKLELKSDGTKCYLFLRKISVRDATGTIHKNVYLLAEFNPPQNLLMEAIKKSR